MLSAQFLLTALVVVIAPGTGVIYTLATGLGQGRRASVMAALGCTAGILPHLGAAALGLAAVLHTSALLFQVVKFAGVAYLLWLAWQALKSGGALSVSPGAARQAGWRIARRGALINILNPKLSIFFFAFLPQFVPADTDGALGQMLGLSGVFMLGTCIYLEFLKHLFTKSLLGEHSLHCKSYNPIRELVHHLSCRSFLYASRITRVSVVLLLVEFLAGKLDLVGINYYDEVTGIKMGSIIWLVLSHQNHCDLSSKSSQRDISRIDDVPFLLYLVAIMINQITECLLDFSLSFRLHLGVGYCPSAQRCLLNLHRCNPP